MGVSRDPLDIDLIIPKPNSRSLTEGLRVGRYNLSTVINRLGLFMRETLTTLEEFAEEQVKINLENKIKIEKLDRSVSELTEQIQSMRQTIVFKDEIVEEKKREIERYKVICEMSSKASMRSIRGSDGFGLSCDANNNINNQRGNGTQAYRRRSEEVHEASKDCVSDEGSLDDLIDSYYSLVKPEARKLSIRGRPSRLSQYHNSRQQMEIIGGVNVKGPSTSAGPVPLGKLINHSPCDVSSQSQAKRVNIALTNQSNAILSSAENIAQQIRHRIHENTAQRQVAGGSYERSSRRKKQWPF